MSFPWSYSFLSDFDNCPRKAYHRYVEKDLPREPASDAQMWGREAHKALEQRIAAGTPLKGRSANFEPLAVAVIAQRDAGKTVLVEQQIAITADGSPVDQYAKDVWGKGRLDVAIVAGDVGFIIDWKTGKEREDPYELEVFALLAKCKWPGLKKVVGSYAWLQAGKQGKVHDLSNFGATFNGIKGTMKTVEMLPPDKEWAANPNPLCGWCPVKKCEHNKT